MKFLFLIITSLLFFASFPTSAENDKANIESPKINDAQVKTEKIAGSIPSVDSNNINNTTTSSSTQNITSPNSAESSNNFVIRGGIGDIVTRNWDALVRSVYVFGGLSVVGFLYLGLRTWRLKRRRGSRRRTGSRRYAPLSAGGVSRGLNQEMEPLGNPEDEEDDDEDTVFDTSIRNNAHA